MARCDLCVKFDDCPFRYDLDAQCSEFELKPMTNGDRIRATSDEILADWMSKIEAKCYGRCGRESDVERFRSQWLDWLKEEAKDGL